MSAFSGGTASGKTTVCDSIMQRLHDQCVVMLSQDSFYRGLTDAEIANVTCAYLPHSYHHQVSHDCALSLMKA